MTSIINRDLLPLWDFGWCDINKVPTTNFTSTAEAIARYLESPDFEITFVEPARNRTPGVHGPFRRDRVKASDFLLIQPQDLQEEIEMIRQPEDFNAPATDSQWRLVQDRVESLVRRSAWIYKLSLTEKDKDHFHDVGGVLFLFREFVFANPNSDYIERLIFGYD